MVQSTVPPWRDMSQIGAPGVVLDLEARHQTLIFRLSGCSMVVERDPSKVNFTKDGQYKLYPDEPLSEENRKEFLAREESQFFDPCKDAAKMSMACLDRNNYDRSKCRPYFEAYRDCLKTWRDNKRK